LRKRERVDYTFFVSRIVLILGLLLALTACSLTVTLPLPDQSLDLPGLTDTRGGVVYPGNGLSFDPPPVDVVQGIRIEGAIEASQSLNATLEFYARTQDPNQDPACTTPTFPGGGSGVYFCTGSSEDQEVGQVTFQNSQQASFTLQGAKLAEGIKAGRLWLGIKASGLPPTPLTLTFHNMKAYVTVGF
jgi:hypothetical protein